MITFVPVLGPPNMTVTITSAGGGLANLLSYTFSDMSDSGTANWTYVVSGSNTTFGTPNIVSSMFGPSGNNSWALTWTTNTSGTGMDDPMGGFGAVNFTYVAGSGGGGPMAPVALTTGNKLIFTYANGDVETFTITGPTTFTYVATGTIAGMDTGTHTYMASGANSTLGITLMVLGVDTYNMTWTSATAGTSTSFFGASNFVFQSM